MINKKPTIIVMFGVSGDLSRRYLLPAIGDMALAGVLPEYFHIVGITRQANLDIENLLEKTTNKEYIKTHVDILEMDASNLDNYKKLDEHLKDLEEKFSGNVERLFYLSLPPRVNKEIITLLGESGLSSKAGSKLVLEKPFGFDLKSAEELVSSISKYFDRQDVYMVDHYLAKKIAQEIVPFRKKRKDFERIWNKDFVEKIEVTASEKIDIEGRVNFYDKTGAIKDFIQSHLVELLSLVIMDLSLSEESEDFVSLRKKALESLKIYDAYLGQYEGYKNQVANQASNTETFGWVSMRSSLPVWGEVPMILCTGKALRDRFAEVKIFFRENDVIGKGELVFNIQPEGKIKWNGENIVLNLSEEKEKLKDAYEYVLFGAMLGDENIFIGEDEAIESWCILEDAEEILEKARNNLIIYKKDSTIEEILSGQKNNE